jgi:hypothetical protein
VEFWSVAQLPSKWLPQHPLPVSADDHSLRVNAVYPRTLDCVVVKLIVHIDRQEPGMVIQVHYKPELPCGIIFIYTDSDALVVNAQDCVLNDVGCVQSKVVYSGWVIGFARQTLIQALARLLGSVIPEPFRERENGFHVSKKSDPVC